jgi:hypothetical protein
MPGVRRPTVTITAAHDADCPVIDYRRRIVTVMYRTKLLSMACECYRIVNSAYDQAFQAGNFA